MYHFVTGQGARSHMEDRYSIPDDRGEFYGLFDGHGGSASAEFCARRAKDLFFRMLPLCNGDAFEVFKTLFLRLHTELSATDHRDSGTTATCIYIKDNEIITANVGDSAAYLWEKNVLLRLTACHRAGESVEETARVERDGGVIRGGRVDYALSITRAIGDFALNPAVQPAPFVSRTTFTTDDAVVVIASDGLWDAIEPLSLPAILEEDASDIASIASNLGSKCAKSGDNYTVGVISRREVTGSSYTFSREMLKARQQKKLA